jgi:Zn-dependent peptidase ImmA (M78 family)
MSVQFARRKAEQLIERFNIMTPPVDAKGIAKRLGLPVLSSDLGEDVSGLLISDGDHSCIAVRNNDPVVRQRFTIAHEIGHFLLQHQLEKGEHVHVDRGNFISKRGLRSAAGIDPKEIEANQFAANLLMPAVLLRQAISELRRDVLLDQHVQLLADTFQVSEQAMTIRLDTLGLL